MSGWLIEIIHNLAILLSLALAFQLLRKQLPRPRRQGRALFGITFGCVAVFSMMTSFEFQPGVVFDGRSIILALAGLFGGGVAGVIAMIIAGLYRGLLSGPGVWAGLGTILVSGLIGIGCRRHLRRRAWPPNLWQLWSVGLLVHVAVLGCMLLIPAPLRAVTVANMTIPFLVVYPLTLVLLGKIMGQEESRVFSLARLEHAEWLFSQAQEVTRFGSWEYRLDTDQLTATAYFHHILGIPDNDAPLSLDDFFGRLHKEDWDLVRLAFDAAIGGQQEIDIQGRLMTNDGRELWIRVVGKPIIIKGKTIQLVGNLVDITRRMTSELALRASEERLQAILDHAPALICICDLEGRIILANRHFKVFGESGRDAVDRPLYELLPRSGALEQWVDDMVTLQAGEHVEFEEVLQHADGTVHTYLTIKFLLAGCSQRMASIGYIATDISDLRRAFAERQRLTEELTVKNDELERFTYSVSHDLKAPLLTIGSYSDLLRDDLVAADKDLVVEDLRHIREAVDKMRLLIDDLLELSRIGKTINEMVPVDLNLIMAEVQALLAGDIRTTAARVVVAPDLPIVQGHVLRLRQVLQNLLQNALKFGDAERQILVEVGCTTEADGGFLITIRDNGCGIKPETLPKIFDLFAHGTDKGAGSGVGLALVRRIMESHGGGVWAESAGPNAGSTFFLRFPKLPVPLNACCDEAGRLEQAL